MVTHPFGDHAQSCLTLVFDSECSCLVTLTLRMVLPKRVCLCSCLSLIGHLHRVCCTYLDWGLLNSLVHWALGKLHLYDWDSKYSGAEDERSHRWETTLLKDHPDERRPCWKTTLMGDSPDERPPCWETTDERSFFIYDQFKKRSKELTKDQPAFKATFCWFVGWSVGRSTGCHGL